MSAQLVDDFKGKTITSASSLDKLLKSKVAKLNNKTEISVLIGKTIADYAKTKKISKIVFMKVTNMLPQNHGFWIEMGPHGSVWVHIKTGKSHNMARDHL